MLCGNHNPCLSRSYGNCVSRQYIEGNPSALIEQPHCPDYQPLNLDNNMLCRNIHCPSRNAIMGTCMNTRYSPFTSDTCPNYDFVSYTPNSLDSDPANSPSYSSNPANLNGNQHIIEEKTKEIEMLRNTIKQLNKTIDLKNEEILTLKGKITNSHERLDV